MKIHFERSGGFAGIRTTATIDSKKLSPEEKRKLREMVDTANFFNLPSVMTAKTPGADRFQYKLTVETEGQQHTIEINEGAVPTTLRPLLEWLTGEARKGKGS